jgi:hypothetical protein
MEFRRGKGREEGERGGVEGKGEEWKGKGRGRRGKGRGERERHEGKRESGVGGTRRRAEGGGGVGGWRAGEWGVDHFMGAGTANPFFLTLRKPEVAEKYLAFVSSPRRSAAEGFTISRPCHR